MDQEIFQARKFMIEHIYTNVMQSQYGALQPYSQMILNLVKHLEDALFKNASSMEEYLDLTTLDNRLIRLTMNPHVHRTYDPRFAHVDPTTSIGTMIPTPGMPQSRNSTRAESTSVDSSIIAGSPESSSSSGNFANQSNVNISQQMKNVKVESDDESKKM